MTGLAIPLGLFVLSYFAYIDRGESTGQALVSLLKCALIINFFLYCIVAPLIFIGVVLLIQAYP